MKRWFCFRGPAITGIGALHALYAVAEYRGTFGSILQDGLIDAVEGAPYREYAFWFLICGLLMICIGSLVQGLDASRVQIPLTFKAGFLLLSGFCVVAVPASGAWALLVPALALWIPTEPQQGQVGMSKDR